MLKQLLAALFLTSVAVAQPFPPREGPVIISQPGTGGTSSSGGLDTNAVIALIEEYAVGGGGIVSNANNLTFVALTIYTNDTVYPLMINASIENRGAAANGASSATIDVDQQPDGAFDYTRIFNLSSSATFTNRTMLTYTIEPGDAWRISTSGGAAIVSGGGQLLYFGSGTNSGGGGGVSAVEVAAIMATNNAQGLTVNGMPAFPAVGAWGNNWEIVSRVAVTNALYDKGGLRVATCYYDKDKINLYYAGYLMPILGGGTNYGQIIGMFGQNWDSMVKHGPVLSPSASGWDSGNIGGARVYKFDNGPTNYMYYFASSNLLFETGWQGQGLATSTDGTNWTKYAGNPILDVTTNGWDYIAIQGAVSVIKFNDIYYMYYGGKGTNSDENIGLATAPSPYGPWTKYGNAPVVTNAADILAEPNVFPLENGRGWGMLLGQGAATSTDLTNWTFHGEWTLTNPFIGTTGIGLYLSPFLFSDNGMASLFDNTTEIFIARPKQAETTVSYTGISIGTHIGRGDGLTNVNAFSLGPYEWVEDNAFYEIFQNFGGSGTGFGWSENDSYWHWLYDVRFHSGALTATNPVFYGTASGGGAGLTNLIIPSAKLYSMNNAASLSSTAGSIMAGYTNGYSNSDVLTASAAAGTITVNQVGDYEVAYQNSGGSGGAAVKFWVLTNGVSTTYTNSFYLTADRGGSFTFILDNVSSGTAVGVVCGASISITHPYFSVKKLK